jgi:hypothetical protein
LRPVEALVYVLGTPGLDQAGERAAQLTGDEPMTDETEQWVAGRAPKPDTDAFTYLQTHSLETEDELGSLSPTGGEWLCLSVAALALILIGQLSAEVFARATQVAIEARGYAVLLVPLVAPALVFGAVHGLAAPAEPAPVHPLRATYFILFYLAVFVFAVVWTVRYTATLPKQAKVRHAPISRADYRPARIAGLLGIASGTYGVLQYGSQSVAVFVWGALVIALLGVFFVGLPGLAAVKGAAHRPALTRLGFAALGLWQGFLTVTVPLILVFYGSWPNALLVTVTVVLGFGLSLVLSRKPSAGSLLLGWLVLGIVALAAAAYDPTKMPPSAERWVVAGALGALFTCWWFGWYLAVCLAFGGHNNEAGGAARLDRYRHFIRFRLTNESLTAYVIGFVKPTIDPGKLEVVLVERFTLRAKGSAR